MIDKGQGPAWSECDVQWVDGPKKWRRRHGFPLCRGDEHYEYFTSNRENPPTGDG
jgi:hypothetical protein